MENIKLVWSRFQMNLNSMRQFRLMQELIFLTFLILFEDFLVIEKNEEIVSSGEDQKCE